MAEWIGCRSSESVGPGLESHSEHFTDLFHGSLEFSNPSAVLVNSQLVCLPPVAILNNVMFHLQYLFQLFEWHTCKLACLYSTEESFVG